MTQRPDSIADATTTLTTIRERRRANDVTCRAAIERYHSVRPPAGDPGSVPSIPPFHTPPSSLPRSA